MNRLLLAYLLCVSVPVLSDAEGQLQGRVLDPGKRPVPQAAVLVRDRIAHQVFNGTTDLLGRFVLRLPPGTYTIDTKRDGFEEQFTTVSMQDHNQQITVKLALKSQTISVTVSDQASHLETASDSHQDSLKLNATALANLPIRDGDVLSALSFFANPAGGQSPTIIVDGLERTDGVTLSVSQVQEVKLNNNAYSAEFPKPGKDRIEIDTKAGTDQYHGGFSFRIRNSIFDARNPLTVYKPPFSREGYELNLSGPILKKRLSFFVSANREDQQQQQPILAYLPSGVLQESILAPFTRDVLLGRLDAQISEGQRLSVKYEFHQEDTSEMGVGAFVLPEAGATRFHRDYRVELSDQSTLSSSMLNNFRLALGTNFERVQSETGGPSIVVPGSFQSGGAQVNDWRREPRYEFQDVFSAVKGSWAWKAGADGRLHPYRSYNADNFGGTYQFASLEGYEAAEPILYTLNAGNPLIVSQQNDYAWFLQAEKRFSRVTLFAGVRHEFQSHFLKYGNLAPRVSAAFALDRSRLTVLRLGAGVFYDRRPPTILQQADRFNGSNALNYVIPNPPFPVIAPPLLTGDVPPAIYRIDPAMTFPGIYQASATMERQIAGGFLASADFTYQRGSHLFRTRNINAPLPLSLVRPDPSLGNLDQIESSASSRGEIFNLTFKSPPKRHYEFYAQYALSYLRDDTASAFGPPPPGGMLPPGVTNGNLFSLPANNYNLRPEWGPASNDIRHRFGLSGTVHLSWHLDVGTLASVRSGLPYDITTGSDNNQDTDPNDRPPGVTRNTGRQAAFFSIDLQVARPVSFEMWGRKIETDFAVDSFNVLNHTNPSNYVGVESSPLFGEPNSAYNGRETQFSVKVQF